MIGIYKYQNKINGHVYIGQSINIKNRQSQHLRGARNSDARDYNSQFHQAIRKYGIDSFTFEVLEEVLPSEYSREYLNELEQFYIKKYNSFKNGYNATEGGGCIGENAVQKGESNGRALLKEEDVIHIRECYNAHIPFREVYKEYKDKITKRGLQKIWHYETWKDILPEYHTEENRYWHSHNAKASPSEVAANNKRAFPKELVYKMREDYKNGVSMPEIWHKYAPDHAKSSVYNAVKGITYKDI